MSDPQGTDLVPPVYQQYRLLTNGADIELDVMHIAVEAFKQLDGDQIANVLDYLTKRYTRRG
jgi:hypothetical protein